MHIISACSHPREASCFFPKLKVSCHDSLDNIHRIMQVLKEHHQFTPCVKDTLPFRIESLIEERQEILTLMKLAKAIFPGLSEKDCYFHEKVKCKLSLNCEELAAWEKKQEIRTALLKKEFGNQLGLPQNKSILQSLQEIEQTELAKERIGELFAQLLYEVDYGPVIPTSARRKKRKATQELHASAEKKSTVDTNAKISHLLSFDFDILVSKKETLKSHLYGQLGNGNSFFPILSIRQTINGLVACTIKNMFISNESKDREASSAFFCYGLPDPHEQFVHLDCEDDLLATSSSSGAIQIWKSQTEEKGQESKVQFHYKIDKLLGAEYKLKFKDKYFFIGSNKGHLNVYDKDTFEPKVTLQGPNGRIESLDFSYPHLACGSSTRTVQLWDIDRQTQYWTNWRFQRTVIAVQFLNPQELIGAEKKEIKFLDTRLNQNCVLNTVFSNRDIVDLAVLPSTTTCLVGTSGGDITVVDMRLPTAKQEVLQQENCSITCLHFKDGQLVYGLKNGEIKQINLSNP
ncbi:hypothetical protein [Candidatus Protochlamydia phocaeensis]|uniref:hypothetical protein n=1 Tax=Candidatus Protochlamydia phocaeensis TaxID=1414722 RepID=UPI0008392097|nr:hypothetical protein [Candidatus Protochlamydia phocaeensis]